MTERNEAVLIGPSIFSVCNRIEEMMTMSRNRYNLTEGELEVAQWILLGYTSKEIGRSLSIAPRTVDQHANNVRMRLGASNRCDMATHLILKNLVALTVEDLEHGKELG